MFRAGGTIPGIGGWRPSRLKTGLGVALAALMGAAAWTGGHLGREPGLKPLGRAYNALDLSPAWDSVLHLPPDEQHNAILKNISAIKSTAAFLNQVMEALHNQLKYILEVDDREPGSPFGKPDFSADDMDAKNELKQEVRDLVDALTKRRRATVNADYLKDDPRFKGQVSHDELDRVNAWLAFGTRQANNLADLMGV